MTKKTLPPLEISRTFDAARERVFRAFTDPAAIPRWFGEEGFEMRVVLQELKDGGRFVFRGMFSAGEWEVRGVYREVRPPERLVFTWKEILTGSPDSEETLVTVVFRDLGGRTAVELKHENDTLETTRSGHEKGWTVCFDRLAAVVAEKEGR